MFIRDFESDVLLTNVKSILQVYPEGLARLFQKRNIVPTLRKKIF